jgi:hypothetical protein
MDANTAATGDAASSPQRKLRLGILVLAIIEVVNTVSDLSVFANLSEYDSGFAQQLLFVGVAIFPVCAIAAVVFAIKGNLRHAIMALAAIPVVAWFTDYLPALFIHGIEFMQGGFSGVFLSSPRWCFQRSRWSPWFWLIGTSGWCSPPFSPACRRSPVFCRSWLSGSG